eukprot:1443-Heterococcus_DN1.PRE.6
MHIPVGRHCNNVKLFAGFACAAVVGWTWHTMAPLCAPVTLLLLQKRLDHKCRAKSCEINIAVGFEVSVLCLPSRTVFGRYTLGVQECSVKGIKDCSARAFNTNVP